MKISFLREQEGSCQHCFAMHATIEPDGVSPYKPVVELLEPLEDSAKWIRGHCTCANPTFVSTFVTGMPGHGKVQVQGTSENWWSRVPGATV
jgi:hypothetical protein